jgi:tRNA (cytidine/uridine-2'-O-)-methyltransferase
MDYLETASYALHNNYTAFQNYLVANNKRLILVTTKTSLAYTSFVYQPNDVLLFGKEDAGVPESLHNSIEHKVTIKMKPKKRSLNLAVSCGIVTTEALRQINLNN